MKYFFNNFVSLALTYLIYLLGGFDVSLKSLVIVMIIDYITGVLAAFYTKKLSSKIGFKGIIKKFSYFLVVALSVVIDNLIGKTGIIRTLVIYFFVANDGLSIIENMSRMGVKLPKKLIESLDQMKNKGD